MICGMAEDEYREYIHRWTTAQQNASICAGCGRTLAAAEPIWWGSWAWRHNWGRHAPHCETCVPAACQAIGRRLPCIGCGRLVVAADGDRRWYHTCSERCTRRARRARRRAARRARRARCTRCGGSFVPTRTDARYCSAACRQQAYRDRKGAE